MRLRGLLVAALTTTLTIVAIGSVALPRPRLTGAHAADPSVALNVRTPVPVPVMSMLRRACFDCHSDETRWPWYARLPVASHLIERDVHDGRGQLNWSHWEEYNPFDRADMVAKVCELASVKIMPPWQYRMLHPDARLSARDVRELCDWTQHEATRLTQGGS
jgi:Haem-binding domain